MWLFRFQLALVLERGVASVENYICSRNFAELSNNDIRDIFALKSLEKRKKFVVPGHTGVLGTLPLTETSVTADSPGGGQLTSTGTRVHGDRFLDDPSDTILPAKSPLSMYLDDEAIADELADGLAGVGIRNLADFVGVEPDLALSAADDGGRETLLGAEVDPTGESLSVYRNLHPTLYRGDMGI